MLELVRVFAEFLAGLTFREWLMYFWPFFLIDLTRYTLVDGYAVFRYLYTWHKEKPVRKRARRTLYREYPLVSVIIPGKDEGPNLGPLIDSLHRQTYDNLEIIVIDDGSGDRTPQIGRRLEAEGRIDRFLRQRMRGGKASAANTGLRWVHGTFVVHVDADSYLADDAIEKSLIPMYVDDDIGAVGGDIRIANKPVNLTTRLQAIEYLKSITIGRTASSVYNILRIVAGAFGTFRTKTLRRIGGWDVGPGLDGDIILKLRKLGFKIRHVPDSVCYTNAPTQFTSLAKQRYRWSRSVVRFRLRKHRDLLNPAGPFTWTDFISVLDNIFFSLILNFKWFIYLLQMIFFHINVIPFLLIINLFLYTLNNVFQFALVKVLLGAKRKEDTRELALFLPLMPLYVGLYLRSVRTIAYVMELLFKASYWDSWNPWKVSKQARKEGV